MGISRGELDTIRDHPDAPKRLRRNSKLVVSDGDISSLVKIAVRLKAERLAREAAEAAPEQIGFDL